MGEALILVTAEPYAPGNATNRARQWHVLTAVIATRIGRFIAYFTIQSNILVAIAATSLARDPARDGRRWRVLRLAGLVGITITAVVHFFLLRPLLDLDGLDYLADKLLHMVVPVLAVACWALFGPRPRITRREVGLAIVWPVVWLAVVLVMGGVSDWYPYPFLDPDEDGWAGVVISSVGVTARLLTLMAGAAWIDRRSSAQPSAD